MQYECNRQFYGLFNCYALSFLSKKHPGGFYVFERQSYRVIKSCSIPLLFVGVFNLVILFVSYYKATFYIHKLDQVKISGTLTAIRMTSVHANGK